MRSRLAAIRTYLIRTAAAVLLLPSLAYGQAVQMPEPGARPAPAAGLSARPATQGRRAPSPVLAGYVQAYGDLLQHFWDPANVIPRIRPTIGNGTVSNTAAYPIFWQMSQVANVLYWHWKLTGTPEARARVRSQYNEVRRRYTLAQLSDARWKGYVAAGIINVQDDASWAIQYFAQVHEVTGDDTALQIAKALVETSWAHYADPNNGGAGLLYATPGQDPGHQGLSSAYEAVAARASLYIHAQTRQAAFLDRAVGTWTWMRQYLRHPSGVYFAELDIRPTVNGAPNPNYRKPIGWDRPQDIKRGGSVAFIGGTMAMASLSAALFAQTGQQRYRDEVASIVAGMLRADTFLRPGAAVGIAGDLLVSDREGWTDGSAAPLLVSDALALPGVDPTGALRAAIRNTALSIIRQRTAAGYYGADWSGPEWNPAHTYQTWAAQGLASGSGSGGGMAVPAQMQTSASSVAMTLAAAILEARVPPR